MKEERQKEEGDTVQSQGHGSGEDFYPLQMADGKRKEENTTGKHKEKRKQRKK